MNFRVNTNKGVKVRIYGAAQDQNVALTVNPLRGSVGRRVHARSADLLYAGGSGASWRVFLATSLMALCALFALLLALAAGVAQAEPPRLVSEGSPLKTEGGVGVAVDQPSGDVYAAGLFRFNAQHNPTELGRIVKLDGFGSQLSPSPFGEGLYSGAAVDPANEDLYVLNQVSGSIETFDPNTGAPIGAFSVEPSHNFFGVTVVQIASDASGDVYVPVVPADEVLEYSSTGVLLGTFTGGSGAGALKNPTGVAVDSTGNLWVADTGNNRIEELTPADVPTGEIKSEGVGSVALDGHGDVLATVDNGAVQCGALKPPCWHLVEYSSAGVQVADVGAGSFGNPAGGGFRPPSMVAVSESSGRAYVTDGEQGFLWVFGRPTAPVVGRELTAEVGVSEAKLGTLVNPGGVAATYRFEYDTRAYAPGEAPHGQSTPAPEGAVGEGFAQRTVWASANDLEPGMTYHYRVVVTNELGTSTGPDRTFATETAEQAACPNQQFRGGHSGRLPDCRAYELVVPPFKNSSQLDTGAAAPDGNAFGLQTKEPLPGAPTGGGYYIFTRGSAAWGWKAILPLESYSGILCSSPGKSSELYAWSDVTSAAIIGYGALSRISQNSGGQGDCNAEGLQVTPGEPVGYVNLLARDNRTGTYRLLNVPPPGVTPADAHVLGDSSDLSHVVFSESAPLTGDAQPGGVEDLYEWDEGALRLLTVLPDGTPASGSLAESSQAQNGNQAISADGTHILFSSGAGLYDRLDGQRTIQVDEDQGGSGSSGGGVFRAASADGSHVLFTDERRLTADSTAAANEPDLYECVLAPGASACELKDLTIAKPGEHADVVGVSGLGSQDDNAHGHPNPHVYFTAKGVLATNRRERLDLEGNPVVEEATSGETNLYLDENDTITFIATLEQGTSGGGVVSPDGETFAFTSTKSLTGYDNVESGSGRHVEEIFTYDAAGDNLECASCNPSGETPTAGGAQLVAASRPLSDGGRVFFETEQALLPADTNGRADVYEFERGRLSLISSGTGAGLDLLGTGSKRGVFLGASESGGDVFFQSKESLLPQDTAEGTLVVYDARVGGGLPARPSPSPCVTADACRTPVSSQPSIYGAPSSQTFSGAGNLVAEPLAGAAQPGPKALTRAQKFTRALNACHRRYRHSRSRRVVCERKTRRTYGPAASKTDVRAKSHKGVK
jgi:hypothetical protein